MPTARKPWWQQATAVVTVSAGGVITGFSFLPGTAEAMTSPTGMPLHLLALDKAAHAQLPDNARALGADAASGDALLRPAIVNIAGFYLHQARTRTPAQVEALIWGETSLDGVDHGESCAAFASLTLQLAAQAVGQVSWVSGGGSYPWPLHSWADVRVDPNPSSLNVTSIVQDATAHGRWHPTGDGYLPQPGDWVLFPGHVEVITGYSNGVLDTIGADSLPGLTINAHSFRDTAAAGVEGFVDNGHLTAAGSGGTAAARAGGTVPAGASAPVVTPTPVAAPAAGGNHASTGQASARAGRPARTSAPGLATIPGMVTPRAASIPGTVTPSAPVTHAAAAPASAPGQYQRYTGAQPSPAPGTRAQQAFISEVAPGAMAAQRRFGVPASVTIAQAIEESAWGHSSLAAKQHNLFGIKGTGPAGTVLLPTSEFRNGQWTTVNAGFRVYHNNAESIADHAELLATSGYYRRAMADRAVPDAFAHDLTGVYATDPEYGANLVALMRLYNLYRFDRAAAPSRAPATAAPARTGRAAQPAASEMPSGGTAQATRTAAGEARIPGVESPATVQHASGFRSSGRATAGVRAAGATAAPRAAGSPGMAAIPGAAMPASSQPRGTARVPGLVAPAAATSAPRYQAELPKATALAFFATAKGPLARAAPLYRDVAAQTGIRWELLAACDWMQCRAHPGKSPVHGEKLGTLNDDRTSYRTKSAALAQAARDLVQLAAEVYRLDLTAPRVLSVTALADAFAAFRWGAILRRHHVSAMEFPYSVAGLTEQHLRMHWPHIDEPDAPDRPGARFREAFGAVPVLLSLDYPATV